MKLGSLLQTGNVFILESDAKEVGKGQMDGGARIFYVDVNKQVRNFYDDVINKILTEAGKLTYVIKLEITAAVLGKQRFLTK
jgi:hypothetical protein